MSGERIHIDPRTVLLNARLVVEDASETVSQYGYDDLEKRLLHIKRAPRKIFIEFDEMYSGEDEPSQQPAASS